MPSDETHVTIIGRDARFKGEMAFDNSCKILGSFEGRIVSQGEIHIADGASCKASIEAKSVMVEGIVEGDVMARERLSLTAKAKVRGDIVAAALVVAEGASFVGQCKVGPAAAKGEEGVSEVEPKLRIARSASAAPVVNVTAQAPTPPWLAASRTSN
ncbi:MAG: polymer-forming cytoskeletal protein [Phycisphaeraceae bacterium]|nr:MAG: polymer-forming cytoskeletal protein [Phycisphaeraceae bacterium]